MVKCFSKSRIFAGMIWIFYVLLAGILLVRRPATPVLIRIFVVMVLVVTGYLIGHLAGNLVADNENTKLLKILYVDLEPGRFLEISQPVLKALSEKSSKYGICSSYYADALALQNKYKEASAFMEQSFQYMPEKPSLKGLYLGSRLRYALLANDKEKAAEYKGELDRLFGTLEASGNKKLKLNLKQNYHGYMEYSNYLNHKTYHLDVIQDSYENSPVLTRKLEFAFLLSRMYRERGKEEKADIYETFIQSHHVDR